MLPLEWRGYFDRASLDERQSVLEELANGTTRVSPARSSGRSGESLRPANFLRDRRSILPPSALTSRTVSDFPSRGTAPLHPSSLTRLGRPPPKNLLPLLLRLCLLPGHLPSPSRTANRPTLREPVSLRRKRTKWTDSALSQETFSALERRKGNPSRIASMSEAVE